MRLDQHLTVTQKTLQQASAETGYSVMAFRHWLAGRSIPRHSTMLRLQEWSGGAIKPADWYAADDRRAA